MREKGGDYCHLNFPTESERRNKKLEPVSDHSKEKFKEGEEADKLSEGRKTDLNSDFQMEQIVTIHTLKYKSLNY